MAVTVAAVAFTALSLACVAFAFVSFSVAALALPAVALSALPLAALSFPVAALAVPAISLATLPYATLSVASLAEPQPVAVALPLCAPGAGGRDGSQAVPLP